jgi:diaminopimelate epimerase
MPTNNPKKHIRFTKMQGAGNDFVVLDETQVRLGLSRADYRFLADRHFGVGADQILTVRPAPNPQVDFEYVIHNADGGEVEQCGNGSRCFVRFVVDKGLTAKHAIKVQTKAGVLEPRLNADGQVTVDMGRPVLDGPLVPFDATGLSSVDAGATQKWLLPLDASTSAATVSVALVSMGNPHAVLQVDDVDSAPVASYGPLVQQQAAFPNGVNVGFMQVLSRSQIRLRVFERGAGETLACGSGACAAVVTGILQGLLDASVTVDTRGGQLRIDWAGVGHKVNMTGPATTVFDGEIDIPCTADTEITLEHV